MTATEDCIRYIESTHKPYWIVRNSEMAEEITRNVLYRQVFDLYATSVDYNPHSKESVKFFEIVSYFRNSIIST